MFDSVKVFPFTVAAKAFNCGVSGCGSTTLGVKDGLPDVPRPRPLVGVVATVFLPLGAEVEGIVRKGVTGTHHFYKLKKKAHFNK